MVSTLGLRVTESSTWLRPEPWTTCGSCDRVQTRAHVEVLERACDLAMQVVALREHHGLSQAELAERCLGAAPRRLTVIWSRLADERAET